VRTRIRLKIKTRRYYSFLAILAFSYSQHLEVVSRNSRRVKFLRVVTHAQSAAHLRVDFICEVAVKEAIVSTTPCLRKSAGVSKFLLMNLSGPISTFMTGRDKLRLSGLLPTGPLLCGNIRQFGFIRVFVNFEIRFMNCKSSRTESR